MRESSGKEVLRLEAAGRVDVAPLLPVEVSSLPRGLHARCIAFHPTKPLLAVGVATCIGGYDLVTGVRQGRVDVRAAPVAAAFSKDGSLLVVATAEWHILGINTSTWRMRVLAPFNELRSAPLDHILMAITGGQRPLIFFTRIGKPSIRMAVNPVAGAEKRSADKKLKWGVKLKLDVSKAVVGLAAHPSSSQLLVLYEDGTMRGYVLASSGLQPIWPASFVLPGEGSFVSRLSGVTNPLQALPHPFVDGAALLAVGLGSPGLLLLELLPKASPAVVLKAPMPGHMPVLGVGLLQVHQVLFVFTTTHSHQLRVLAWQMINANATGRVSFEPIHVDVPELDAEPTAGAAAANKGSNSKMVAATAGGNNGGSGSAAGGGGGGNWQSLWGGDFYGDALQNAAAGSFLLDKLLAPVVQSAVLHPTLGCVAVQRAPPAALRQAANIMQQRLGLISAPEALISRRTASVPLLRLLRPTFAGLSWPGTRVAAMHTDISFWQPAAGLGAARLQFPCHLYFLSPGKLSKYSLASKRSGCFVALPSMDASGAPHEARQLVHSPKQHAWLVFFERRSSAGAGAGAGGGADGGAGAGGGASGAGSHFTLVQDSAKAGQATWFLPGKTGVFLGPQDLYFAVLDAGSPGSAASSPEADSTVSVYRTPGFKGTSHALYTIRLGRPAGFGCGLLPGPPALAAPRVGAEAAARAAREAEEAADAAAKDAAAATADGGPEAVGSAAADDGGAAGAAAATTASGGAQEPRPRIRRPGETWRPSAAEDDDDDGGGNMMVPVLGVGPAFQGPVGKGLGFRQKGGARHQQGFGFEEHQEEPEEEAGERHSGGGVVMWHAAGDKLVMAGLPAPGVQYAAGDDSDDPDAAEATAAAAPDMGQATTEHSLQLQPLERVVTVVWQNTTQAAPLEPYQTAAAILTTQRLLLVTGDLSVVASVDASCGSVGLANGITSLLWVGPALLFMTAAGQVMQLTWTGQTQHMASVSNQPLPLLAGALADSLLLVRQNPVSGEPEVTSRAVGILQPLVIGWTSLASSGLLPKGLNTARAALQALLESFDATQVTSGMLWSLIQGWCGDVAAALAAHATDVEPSVQLAANAAAGRWSAVVSALRGEHSHSVFFPAPAPQGSQLHHKLLAAAAGAIMHGQFSAAQECLEAAGEWETMMAVCVCSGDFAALRSLAAGLQSGTATAAGGDQEAADIARLARALVGAYERGGRAFALNRIVGASNNWRLRAMMADDSFFSNAAEWAFGGPGKQPIMETSSFNAPASFIQDGDVGPLPRADDTTLGAYLGNTDLAATSASAAAGPGGIEALAAGAGGAGGGRGLVGVGGPVSAGLTGVTSDEADFLANLDNLVALSNQRGDAAKSGLRRNSSAASSVDSDFLGGGGGDAGASAAAVAGGAQRDPFAFSDDEDDDGTSFGYKFKIHIKETDNPVAAGATGASTADLRAAASKIKLAGPTSSGSFREQLGRSGSGASRGPFEEGRGDAGGGVESLYDLSFLGKPPGSQQQQQGAAAAAAGTSGPPLPPKSPQPGGGASSSAAAAMVAAATGRGSGAGVGPVEQPEDTFMAIGEMTGIRSSGAGLGGPAMRPRAQAAAAATNISDDDFFAALAPAITGGGGAAAAGPRGGARGGAAAGQQQQQQAQQGGAGTAAASSGVEDFFADFSGTTTTTTSSNSNVNRVPSLAPPPAMAAGAAAAAAAGAAGAAAGGSSSRAPRPPPAPAASLPRPAAAAGPTGGDATALYMQGVAAMESSEWDAAAAAFGGALSVLQVEPPSASRSERQAFAAQYLAAVLLLKAACGRGVSTAKAARLYRYAAALKLDERHSMALVKESVIRNKQAGNFRYAADELTVLVTRSLGVAPMEVMARLQEDIDECDAKGGRNASVQPDENVADFVQLVAVGASRQDVEEVVLPLLQQA